MSLFYVQNDTEYVRVRRHGRFSLDRAWAESVPHRRASIRNAVAKMIGNMERMGYEYVDDGQLEVRGPLEHLEFSEESLPGPVEPPHPLDVAGLERWDKAGQAQKQAMHARDRLARELVDFQLVMTFQLKVPTSMRALPAQPKKGAFVQ